MTSTEIVSSQRITIDQAYESLEKALVSFLKTVPPSILPFTGHLSNSLGKNLRGKALLISALGDDNLVDSKAVDLAVAIEMFHLATLVHDDIIDDAELRRGQKSLQAQFGKKTAVLCGDYLLARSLELSARSMTEQKNDRKTNDFSMLFYSSLVCLGEIRQHANNFNLNLSVRRYLSIIRGKTAVLFEAALAGGEFFVKEEVRVNQENREAYKKIGRYIGMIFQMMDDLIDIEKSVEEAKKPILSDLKAGVITLPLILAMQKDPTIKKDIESQITLGEIQPDMIQQKIIMAGGTDETRRIAQRYYDGVMDEIHSLNLIKEKEQALIGLLDKAMGNNG